MTDFAGYCREIETYLCQKNEGHLVRIVGPAFEQVCSWAERGVPLKIAFKGIDRYCERYYAKGGRRRPVRIEFCQADILDAFDDWRRAVGIVATAAGEETDTADTQGRKGGLAAHIERAVSRLRAVRGSNGRSSEFIEHVDRTLSELDSLACEARNARGENRARIVERLAALDGQLIEAAMGEVLPGRAEVMKREAEADLAPFGPRMSPEAREKAVSAAFQRLVRETLGVPILTYD